MLAEGEEHGWESEKFTAPLNRPAFFQNESMADSDILRRGASDVRNDSRKACREDVRGDGEAAWLDFNLQPWPEFRISRLLGMGELILALLNSPPQDPDPCNAHPKANKREEGGQEGPRCSFLISTGLLLPALIFAAGCYGIRYAFSDELWRLSSETNARYALLAMVSIMGGVALFVLTMSALR